jgi:hypothetical protein
MPQETGVDGRMPLIIMFESFFNGHFRVGEFDRFPAEQGSAHAPSGEKIQLEKYY